jgi:hypothetical protein
LGTNMDVPEMRNNLGVTAAFNVRCPTNRWIRARIASFAS